MPELGPDAIDVTEACSPSTTRVSKPPDPPSRSPSSRAPCAKVNVSLLSAAPLRFSTPVKLTFWSSVPALTPVTRQEVSAAGPAQLFLPPPPPNHSQPPPASHSPLHEAPISPRD